MALTSKRAGDQDAQEAPSTSQVLFHYIKSNSFRVVHVDGAIGAPTARGYVHVALYNERATIPQQAVVEFRGDAAVPERITETKGGVVREVEVSLLMDQTTAEELTRWLTVQIERLKQMKDRAV